MKNEFKSITVIKLQKQYFSIKWIIQFAYYFNIFKGFQGTLINFRIFFKLHFDTHTCFSKVVAEKAEYHKWRNSRNKHSSLIMEFCVWRTNEGICIYHFVAGIAFLTCHFEFMLFLRLIRQFHFLFFSKKVTIMLCVGSSLQYTCLLLWIDNH